MELWSDCIGQKWEGHVETLLYVTYCTFHNKKKTSIESAKTSHREEKERTESTHNQWYMLCLWHSCRALAC